VYSISKIQLANQKTLDNNVYTSDHLSWFVTTTKETYKQRLENTEGSTKNEQSRETEGSTKNEQSRETEG
jgi:hypothetical protein